MATPSESGTAITSARSEEANVPKISGKAPNSSATGSHLLMPGESVQLWGFYAAPPADVTTVDVEIGGLAMVAPTPITG